MALSPAFIAWEQRTRQEGVEQTWREAIADTLEARFGSADSQEVADSLASINSLDTLKALHRQAISVDGLEAFQQLLEAASEG